MVREREILSKVVYGGRRILHIEVGDVDLDACKSFINQGKGGHRPPYFVFRQASAWCSKTTCTPHRANRCLFETRRFWPFTKRRIQQIVQGYREISSLLPQRVLSLRPGALPLQGFSEIVGTM